MNLPSSSRRSRTVALTCSAHAPRRAARRRRVSNVARIHVSDVRRPRPVRMALHGSERRLEAARARVRTRDRPSRQTARADSIFTRNIPFLAPLGRRSPDPPILKSGEKGVLARRVRALQPQKHPQNTPTPKTPPQTPPKTPRVSNVEPAHSCCSDVLAAARPDVRMVPQRRLLKPRGRDQPSNPRPRCRGPLFLHETSVSCTFWEPEPRPPYTKE